MDWKQLLAYITGTVDQELLLRNEYLVTENRILRNQVTGRVRLTDGERKALAEIGQKLGMKALEAVVVRKNSLLTMLDAILPKCDNIQAMITPVVEGHLSDAHTVVSHLLFHTGSLYTAHASC